MTDAIDVHDLTKHYRQGGGKPPLCAVDGISFAVHPGEVFGFLGPNGAGKTTTIRMLTGLTGPTAGSGQVLGLDILKDMARIKKRIGVVPETSNLYDELSAYDNLVFDMQLYGMPRSEWKAQADDLLQRFRLNEKRDAPFAKLSRGMKRALTIAAALAHRPALLFLDEPTTGLDVMAARQLRQMIAGLRDQGVTVFLTTHYLEEAERLCDRIAVIVKGRIVALGSLDELKAGMATPPAVTVTAVGPDERPMTKRVEAATVAEAIHLALSQVGERHVLAINTERPSLEDVFVKLTGLSADVMLMEKGGRGQGNAGG
jgi:ABC-2 type transport system ATP-binding protein